MQTHQHLRYDHVRYIYGTPPPSLYSQPAAGMFKTAVSVSYLLFAPASCSFGLDSR